MEVRRVVLNTTIIIGKAKWAIYITSEEGLYHGSTIELRSGRKYQGYSEKNLIEMILKLYILAWQME